MPAALLVACLLFAPGGDAPDVDALQEAALGGGPGAEEAFVALVDSADDWRDLRTQDRSIPAADALRELAEGTGPLAGRAADALADRRVAILGDLDGRGDYVRPVMTFRDPRPPLRGQERFMIEQPAPRDQPHPLVRLRLLDLSEAEVTVRELFDRGELSREQFRDVVSLKEVDMLMLAVPEEFEDDWLEPLRGHPRLTRIELSDGPLGPAGCAILATIPHLESVSLPRCPIGGAGLAALADSPSIQSFNLRQCGITDDGLRALTGRPDIASIALTDNPITDAGFSALPLAGVRSLDLTGTQCGDGALKHLRGRWGDPPTGRHDFGMTITLAGTAVTDAGLAHLTDAPKISTLDVGDTAVTGTGFAAFAKADAELPGSIDAAGGAFNDAGCAALARCRTGDVLNLDLWDTPVTDAGLAHFGTIANLWNLHLGGPQVTDAGLAKLTGCTKFNSLLVRSGPITGAGLANRAGMAGRHGVPWEEKTAGPGQVTLWNDAATTEGVRAVASMPGLKSFMVTGGTPTDAVWSALAERPGMDSIRFSNVPVAGPGLADLAEMPLLPRHTHVAAGMHRRPLLFALIERGWGDPLLGAPRGWPAEVIHAGGPGLLAAPVRNGLLVLATRPRLVPPTATPSLRLELTNVGMTDELLRSLPPFPSDNMRLGYDDLSPEAVLEFVHRQPQLRELTLTNCPAASAASRAAIAAALEARKPRHKRPPGGGWAPPAGAVAVREAMAEAWDAVGAVLPVPGGAKDAEAVAADLTAVRAADGQFDRDAAAAFVRLVERAGRWRDLRTQDRSVPAADALRQIAGGDGPFADRATAALAAREKAILADLRSRGTHVLRESVYGRSLPIARFTRLTVTCKGAPPGPGHPVDRLSLLNLDDVRVVVAQRGSSPSDRITAEQFARLCAVPRLAEISMEHGGHLSERSQAWLAPLRNHPTLEAVSLQWCGVSGGGCEILGTIPNLAHLNLSMNDLTDADFRRFGGRALRSVHLNNTDCGDGAARCLRTCWADVPADAPVFGFVFGAVGSKDVNFSRSELTDEGLAALAAAPTPWRLDLTGTAVTGTGFGAWADAGRPLPPWIFLSATPFDDAGCAALARCQTSSRGLTLDLTGAAMTVEGVAALAGLERLTELSVGRSPRGGEAAGGPGLSDEALAPLARCSSLRSLTVQGEAVGPGLAALADRQPAPRRRGIGVRTGPANEIVVPAWQAVLSGHDHRPAADFGETFTHWPRFIGPATALRVPADPLSAAAALVATLPRRAPPPPPFQLKLWSDRLDDALLRSLPPLGATDVSLTGGNLTPAALLDFARRQPTLRILRVDGPAGEAARTRLNSILELRRPRPRSGD